MGKKIGYAVGGLAAAASLVFLGKWWLGKREVSHLLAMDDKNFLQAFQNNPKFFDGFKAKAGEGKGGSELESLRLRIARAAETADFLKESTNNGSLAENSGFFFASATALR